jgi:hypothetical protein
MSFECRHDGGLMPLFDDPVPYRLLWPMQAPWPRRRARMLLRRFKTCFPEITYDIDPAVALANAQAFLDHGLKRVRLYGGLVHHRRIGSAGLAVALAHETGHHLGGAPYLRFYRWLSSEERATEWAMTVGLKAVYGSRAGWISDRGLHQLKAVGMG